MICRRQRGFKGLSNTKIRDKMVVTSEELVLPTTSPANLHAVLSDVSAGCPVISSFVFKVHVGKSLNLFLNM